MSQSWKQGLGTWSSLERGNLFQAPVTVCPLSQRPQEAESCVDYSVFLVSVMGTVGSSSLAPRLRSVFLRYEFIASSASLPPELCLEVAPRLPRSDRTCAIRPARLGESAEPPRFPVAFVMAIVAVLLELLNTTRGLICSSPGILRLSPETVFS